MKQGFLICVFESVRRRVEVPPPGALGEAWPWNTGPRLPVPVHISIHNVHAGAFNHSYISNEIQLHTVINDGVLITANNWPSALRHADPPWNSDPTEPRLRLLSRSRIIGIGGVQPFHQFV